MKIIIVGDGKTGFTPAEHLSREEHDITIVDTREEALQRASDAPDVMTVKGSGFSISALNESGVAQTDIPIAVTNSDEVNMVCCITGKQLGAKLVKPDGRVVENRTLYTITIFLCSYMHITFDASPVVAFDNFSAFSSLSKLTLTLCMIIGRLEIFPVPVLFSRAAWRKY